MTVYALMTTAEVMSVFRAALARAYDSPENEDAWPATRVASQNLLLLIYESFKAEMTARGFEVKE